VFGEQHISTLNDEGQRLAYYHRTTVALALPLCATHHSSRKNVGYLSYKGRMPLKKVVYTFRWHCSDHHSSRSPQGSSTTCAISLELHIDQVVGKETHSGFLWLHSSIYSDDVQAGGNIFVFVCPLYELASRTTVEHIRQAVTVMHLRYQQPFPSGDPNASILPP
jgi:hypothetical protein